MFEFCLYNPDLFLSFRHDLYHFNYKPSLKTSQSYTESPLVSIPGFSVCEACVIAQIKWVELSKADSCEL